MVVQRLTRLCSGFNSRLKNRSQFLVSSWSRDRIKLLIRDWLSWDFMELTCIADLILVHCKPYGVCHAEQLQLKRNKTAILPVPCTIKCLIVCLSIAGYHSWHRSNQRLDSLLIGQPLDQSSGENHHPMMLSEVKRRLSDWTLEPNLPRENTATVLSISQKKSIFIPSRHKVRMVNAR